MHRREVWGTGTTRAMIEHLRILSIANRRELERELEHLGIEPVQARGVAAKGIAHALKVEPIPPREANILRQELLSLGAEAVVARGSDGRKPTATILLATMQQYYRLVDRLAAQPGTLPQLGRELAALLRASQVRRSLELRAGPHTFRLGTRTHLMGILNLTVDSFSGDGLAGSPDEALERARRFVAAGVDVVDVGGESARADTPVVDAGQEIARVVPVIEAIVGELGVPVSIDTYKPQVAEAAVAAGACIINDISGFKLGMGTAEVAARTGAALVINHTYERPKIRPARPPAYDDLMGAIFAFLRDQMALALSVGVKPEQIILDPGIAFGKSHDEDLVVIRRLRELDSLGRPLLVAPSRKNFIGSVTGTPVEERVGGTAAVVALAIANGADFIRVHDVAEMVMVAAMADAVCRGEQGDFAATPGTWPAPDVNRAG